MGPLLCVFEDTFFSRGGGGEDGSVVWLLFEDALSFFWGGGMALKGSQRETYLDASPKF